MGSWLLLLLASPLASTGVGACLYGRLGLVRQGDRYAGSGWAWAGYFGGMVACLAAVLLLVVGAVGFLG